MNYHLLNNSIVLNYNGKTIIVSRDDDRFESVKLAIIDERLDDIPAIVEIERKYNGNGVELVDGIVHVHGTALPAELSARVLAYKKEGLDFTSLLNFWNNLKSNPSFNSRRMLFKFLEHNGHPLTMDGCFIAYKGVRDDYRDVHSGKFDNSAGALCQVERFNVDDNPDNTCSFGLHVACYEYAKDFGVKLMEVKINPADVVAVPNDYNGTKMRVCKYEVIQECQKKLVDMQVYPEESEEEVDLNMFEGEKQCPDCDSYLDGHELYCPTCGSEIID